MSVGPAPGAAGNRDGPGPMAAVRWPWLTRNVAVLCGVSFLQDTASELLYPILPIFLTTVLGAPVAVVGIAEGAADGAAALTKVAAGRIADRTERRPLIAAGYGLAAVGKVLIALAYVWRWYWRPGSSTGSAKTCAARPVTRCSWTG